MPKVSKIYVWNTLVRPTFKDLYQEVEYIQSTWTQYINTSIAASDTKWVYMKLSTQDRSTDLVYFWASAWGDTRFVIWNASNQMYIAWNSKNNVSISANTIYEVKNNYLNDRKIYLNTSLVTSSLWTLSSSNTYNVKIFAWNYSWNTSFNCKIRLYSLKISDSGNIIADFVPCYRKSDSVIWLYDLVNNQFYTNAWSWTFTKWSDV